MKKKTRFRRYYSVDLNRWNVTIIKLIKLSNCIILIQIIKLYLLCLPWDNTSKVLLIVILSKKAFKSIYISLKMVYFLLLVQENHFR